MTESPGVRQERLTQDWLERVDLSPVCLGTMRFDSDADFLCQLHDLGIDSHHSSHEYETDAAYLRALNEAMDLGYRFKHVVKVAEPSWDHQKFSKQRLKNRLTNECDRLGVDHLDVIQWLVRTKTPDDETVCIPIMEGQGREIGEAFDELVSDGLVGAVVGFPYRPRMAQAMLAQRRPSGRPLIDGLSIYLNAIEPDRSDEASMELTSGGPLLAIRPFAGGQIPPEQRESSFKATIDNPNVVSVIVSMSSVQHARELLALAPEQR